MAKIIGIDLGTTNSVAAVVRGGEPTVIPTAEDLHKNRNIRPVSSQISTNVYTV